MDSFDNVTNTTISPITTTESPHTVPIYIGYIGVIISVIFLGSNFLPIKRYQTGDGIFFQLMLTTGIWIVGFIVNWARGFPQFYALPMLGGFLWTTGNLNTVPVMNTIGLGLGTLFPNTVLLCLGWAIARFGWFGIKPEVPSNVTFNYLGVVLTVVSGLFFVFIKPSTGDAEEDESLINNQINQDNEIEEISSDDNSISDVKYFGNLSPNLKRIIGISLACIAGVLYAFTFTPALYVQDNYTNASDNALDFVFSLYTGIFLTSIVYFSIYCLVKKNKPVIYQEVILPAIVSGLMWGIGNSSFFLANNALTQAITFPIVSSGPSIVANLWGVVLYKEVKGIKNLSFLLVGFVFAILGSVFCGISK